MSGTPRIKAAAIHLGLTALVIVAVGVSGAVTWYPPNFAQATGGLRLFGILVIVSICLGPLLTLTVFDARKRSLPFDLAMVVLLQLLALTYGLYTMFLFRPVFVVFTIDRFELVTAADIPADELARAKRDEFKALPLMGPKIIAVQMPTNAGERTKILFSALVSGVDLQHYPKNYIPYSEMSAEASRKALPVSQLMERDSEAYRTLSAYLESKKLERSNVKFLPLRAKKHDQTVLLDSATGEVLGIVNVWPWREPP